MNRVAFCLSALALAGCTAPPAPPASTTIPASPAADSTAAAAPAPAPMPPPSAATPYLLVGRAVVDVPNRAVVRLLTKDLVIAGALDGAVAYLCVGYWKTPPQDSMSHELRAYEIVDGKQRWAKPVSDCRNLAAGPTGVLVGTYRGGTPGATWHDGVDGTPREVASGPPVVAVQRFGQSLLALHDGGALDVLDGASLAVRGTATLPFTPWPLYPGIAPFVDRGTELCAVNVDGRDLDARCMDASRRVRFSAHESLGGGGGMLLERGERWVVTTMTQGPPRSLVFDLGSGTVAARIDATLAATVRDEAGKLDGLLATIPQTQLLDRSGQVQWTSPEPQQARASALVKNGLIFVASYHAISTGATLVAFDRKTGAVRWRGDLQLLPISHSIYSNHVDLDFLDGALAIRGHESGQEYFELFAPDDGTPLFRVVQER
jgi:putative pyrroloquinoline-quinone binding quinoprotein